MSSDQPAPSAPTPPVAAPVAPHHGLVVPSLAAFAAALVGGVIWAVVVKLTDYEIGYAAVGIGLLAGFAAARAARPPVGEVLPFVVGAIAALGVLFGKVLAFYLVARDVVDRFGSTESAFSLTVHNITMPGVWSFYDLLWLSFAVLAAYRFTAARVGEPAPAPAA